MFFVGLVSCFFFSSRRRHTRSLRDWSSDVCSSGSSSTKEWIATPVGRCSSTREDTVAAKGSGACSPEGSWSTTQRSPFAVASWTRAATAPRAAAALISRYRTAKAAPAATPRSSSSVRTPVRAAVRPARATASPNAAASASGVHTSPRSSASARTSARYRSYKSGLAITTGYRWRSATFQRSTSSKGAWLMVRTGNRARARRPARLRRWLEVPGVEDEGPVPPGGESGVQDVARVNGLDALHHVGRAHAVKGRGGEAAGVYLAALVHERLELPVVVHVAGEGLVAHLWEPAGRGRDERAGPEQDDVGVEALAADARCGQEVDNRYGALEGDAMHEDVRLLSWLSLVVLEDLVLVVDDCLTGVDTLVHELCHVRSPP